MSPDEMDESESERDRVKQEFLKRRKIMDKGFKVHYKVEHCLGGKLMGLLVFFAVDPQGYGNSMSVRQMSFSISFHIFFIDTIVKHIWLIAIAISKK